MAEFGKPTCIVGGIGLIPQALMKLPRGHGLNSNRGRVYIIPAPSSSLLRSVRSIAQPKSHRVQRYPQPTGFHIGPPCSCSPAPPHLSRCTRSGSTNPAHIGQSYFPSQRRASYISHDFCQRCKKQNSALEPTLNGEY